MLSYIWNYIEMDKEKEKQREELYRKIEKHEIQIKKHKTAIEKLNKRINKIGYVSWIDTIIKPLAEELKNRLNKKYYDIYGPFGINARTYIYFKDENKNITETETLSIGLRPDDLKNGVIRYETGEIINKYPEGSIGELNGSNCVTVELPDNIEEIIKIILRGNK